MVFDLRHDISSTSGEGPERNGCACGRDHVAKLQIILCIKSFEPVSLFHQFGALSLGDRSFLQSKQVVYPIGLSEDEVMSEVF